MNEMMPPVDGVANMEPDGPDAIGATELVKYDAACRALAEALSTDEVKNIHDVARQIAAAARIAKNRDLEADAFELRSRAELRLGEMIKAQKKTVGLNKGTAGQGRPPLGGSSTEPPKKDDRPTLAEAGIPKSLSSKAQKLSDIPPVKFEQMIKEGRAEIQRPAEKRLLKEVEVAERRAAYEARGQRVSQSTTPRQPKGVLAWADAWSKQPLKRRQVVIEEIGPETFVADATDEQRSRLLLALVRRLRAQERRPDYLDAFDKVEALALPILDRPHPASDEDGPQDTLQPQRNGAQIPEG